MTYTGDDILESFFKTTLLEITLLGLQQLINILKKFIQERQKKERILYIKIIY